MISNLLWWYILWDRFDTVNKASVADGFGERAHTPGHERALEVWLEEGILL